MDFQIDMASPFLDWNIKSLNYFIEGNLNSILSLSPSAKTSTNLRFFLFFKFAKNSLHSSYWILETYWPIRKSFENPLGKQENLGTLNLWTVKLNIFLNKHYYSQNK